MRPIRITYLLDRATPTTAGTERQLLGLIGRLDRALFVPHICFLEDGRWPTKTQDVVEVDSPEYAGTLSPTLPRVVWKLTRAFRSHRIDIVHTFFIDSIYLGVLAGRLAGVPAVITSRRDMGYWYSPGVLTLLRIANRWSQGILVNSESVRQNVIRRESAAEKLVSVIPNGIDLTEIDTHRVARSSTRASLGVGASTVVIGLVANLRPVKRADVFLRALAGLPSSEAHTWRGVIVGDGPLRTQLEALAHDLGIADRVSFVGRVENPVPWIHAFDIGVLTSESEGFPNAVLEQMAVGLPVVATDGGGSAELLRDGRGLLIPVGDEVRMSEAIALLMSDRTARERFGRSARRFAEFHDWDRIAPMFVDYYKRVLERVSSGHS
jgi:glycosyltransferase involved in cell wall biosynthesis